ncbi:hypothetical protein BC567DRAFT_261017 [Phyllosticta citribraziliensis]
MTLNTFLASLKSTWADWRILMAARDDLDDDYNFASGPRRGAELAYYEQQQNEEEEQERRRERKLSSRE